MLRKPHDHAPKAPREELPAEEGAPVPADQAPAVGGGGAALVEPLPEMVQRLEQQVGEWKDRALRASADFDNYRKRAMKEQSEAAGRGQAQALERILDVIDDLARVAHLDPAKTSAEALHEGMLAIERKFVKVIEAAGLERFDPMGQPFDPKTMEAVATMPAPTPEADQTVGAVYQAGYRYRGTLLRPARVVVLQWSGEAPAPESPPN
jgi:molecular chaperone GrpE